MGTSHSQNKNNSAKHSVEWDRHFTKYKRYLTVVDIGKSVIKLNVEFPGNESIYTLKSIDINHGHYQVSSPLDESMNTFQNFPITEEWTTRSEMTISDIHFWFSLPHQIDVI
jgi:hypothetical protein